MNNSGGRFKIGLKPLLLLAGFFIALLAFANSAQARTNIYAPSVDISTPTTWTVAGSPYVISGWAWLDVTATLTIEPGVVIKFTPDHFNQRYNGINVSGGGKIMANGTSDAPVIFTSYYDDTASGDTNGDGTVASPVAGDWRGIILDADASALSHVEVRYAANIYQSYGAVEIKNNSTASLSDVSIKYSAGSALRLNQPSSPTITDITIDTSNDYGIYSTIAGSSVNIINATITNATDGVATLAVGNTLAFTNAVVANTKPVINLTGATVSTNATWPKIGSVAYVLDNDIGVATGVTLTIAPGVVVKGEYGAYPDSRLEISGRLLAQGTADQPIVFTSLRDDTVGGDSNNDASTSSPAAGDWGGLYFENSAGSIFDYATVRYGGNYSDDFNGVFYSTTDNVMLHLKNSSLSVATSTIGLANTAIYLESTSALTMSGSTVATTTTGFLSSSSLGSTISGTSFINNTHFAISNFGSGQIDGRNNWWGDDSGPTITSNPSGTGNSISNNVLYSPWTVHTPPNQPPVLSYVGSSGYTADGVEPNVSFKNSTLPVFKVLYSDAENAVSYIRLVTASSTVAMATSTGGVYDYTPAGGTYGKGSYSYHFEASDGVATARLPTTGELSFEVKNVPVILVPGIAGTELWKGGEKIWPNFIKMLSLSDSFMDVLLMTENGLPVDDISLGDILKEPISNFYNVFQGLIDRLQLSGYQENDDLFVFPYDWRFDIRNTSQQLKNKITAVKSMTDSSKVNIVAHSMGGLLSKQYILDNGSDSIDKIIFIGTPNLGAPKAAKTLMFGDSLGVEIFIPILSAERIRIIGQNMPSLYQLLPSQEYFNQIGNYYSTMSGISYDYQGMNNFFINNWNLNSSLLQNAKNFHSSALDTFDASGLDAYNINGCDTATIKRIFKRDDGIDYSLIDEAGDGTVPLESSRAINIPSGRMYYFKGIEHATMPSANGIRELVGQIITGSSINLADNATQDSSVCKLKGKTVSVHSPVNLHIYDQNGNHVGRGENGTIDYNITGVAYEEIGENKFVFLPTSNGQTYQIELDGTGVGTYSLRVSKIEDDQVVETAYYSDLPVNTSTEATVTLASSVSNTVLQVDQNGTGSFAPAAISAVLDSTEATDITQPTSTITVTGGQTSATVSLTATDDNAGVLKIEYSTNGGSTWNTYANSFIITTLGNTTVQYRATDRAGNVESAKSQIVTVTAAPNAVISIPSATTSSSSNIKNTETTPQVLGEQKERPVNEQYMKDQILDALADADTNTLLDYLGKTRDTDLEAKVGQDYGKYLVLDKAATNFITYGTKSTDKLGIGERAGVLRSYQYAFGKLPLTAADWQDAVNIATNQLPVKRSSKAEQETRAVVRKIYGKLDNQSVLMIAYGLRPETRDIKKEQLELKRFGRIFGKMPSSVFDWNIFRKLVY